MPYPPPPGPPFVGEFQAIGLLPAPQIPDVTGQAGKFLETDGVIPQWEPVSGTLPDQTGQGGKFLTTNGTVASWAAVSSILPDQTGHAGNVLGTDGSNASWVPNGGAGTYDIRVHGAVANDITNDVAQAFYNTLAAWSTIGPDGNIGGAVAFSEGLFYTSMPLCVPSNADIYGVNNILTVINPGLGTGLTSTVQSFAGPLFYGAPAYTPSQLPSSNFPSLLAPLVGATGNSLQMHSGNDLLPGSTACLYLDDAWCWGTWMGNNFQATAFSLQFWVKITDTASPAFFKGIIGSRGPSIWASQRGANLQEDIAFGVYASSDGTHVTLKAFLTTNANFNGPSKPQPSGTQVSIVSSNVSLNTSIHVELDYDGNFFDFYVNGVNQGHVSAQGPICRAPWEGTAIGSQGGEFLEPAAGALPGINGAIDSIRLSNVARHTGTGSFTPPVAKYTWDANTYALYNWDQGVKTVQPKHPDGSNNGPLLTLPFLVGQTVGSSGSIGFLQPGLIGPVPHYIKLFGSNISGDSTYRDFGLNGQDTCSGIIVSNAPRTLVDSIWTIRNTKYGIKIWTGVSFYCTVRDSKVSVCAGTGIELFGEVEDCEVDACGIGFLATGGISMKNCPSQPAYNSYAGAVFQGLGGGSTCTVTGFSYDNEAYIFVRTIAVGVVFGAYGTAVFTQNGWPAQSSAAPPFMYFDLPLNGRGTHIGDTFIPNPDGQSGLPASPCSIAFWAGNALPTSNLLLLNCQAQDANVPALPESNVDGWIGTVTGSGTTNQRGLSITEVPANNIAGTFSIQNGFTQGGPVFLNAEPDTNYIVQITPLDYLGSAPAAGAERVLFPIVRSQGGFLATIGADPGGTSTARFAYQLTRTQRPPLYFNYLPTVPSNVANPLFGQAANAPFAAGVTVVPAGGNVLVWNTGQAFQSILEAGTTVFGTNWWELALAGGSVQWELTYSAFPSDVGALVRNGRLLNILNPGAHNIVIGFDGLRGFAYFDGQFLGGAITPPGTQQSTLYIGQRFDTTKTLTTATLRNLKVDTEATLAVSNDNDIGPGSQQQSAFFGDDWTLGFNNTTALGGFAQQIAQARYGTSYYWMAGLITGKVLGPSTFNTSLVTNIWNLWQGVVGAPQLTNLNIMAGWNDILAGSAATDIFAGLKQVLEGTPSTNTWLPPTSNSTPIQQRAFAILAVPRNPATPGTCVYHIGGFPISSTFNTDGFVTAAALVTAINGNASIAALVTPSVVGPTPQTAGVQLLANVVGTGGNGIAVTADGGAGGFCYGDIGGGFGGTGLSVLTFNGKDTTAVIAGVTFVSNFVTDVNTTVDNLVALVNADVTVGALVTASRVASQMLITANANGTAGNTITTGGSAVNVPGSQPWVNTSSGIPHMTGGSNGAIQNGITNIRLCNVPPIGTNSGSSAPKITQLNSLNTLINAYTGSGVTVMDVNTALRDPAAHDNLNPLYDTGGGTPGYLNNVGHTALFTFLAPVLPGVGTPPSALSYATNPASYAHSVLITPNSPTVTGIVVRWTVSPPLPTGLAISSTTGIISGTPTTITGAANYRVCATNTAGTIFVDVNITIT